MGREHAHSASHSHLQLLEHNLRKILAICTEPWAFRRLHEVFADHTGVQR